MLNQQSTITDVINQPNPHVYKAQSEVLKTVDSFVKENGIDSVEALNHLLYQWIASSPGKQGLDHLKQVLSVVNFLVRISGQCKQVEEVKTLTARLSREE